MRIKQVFIVFFALTVIGCAQMNSMSYSSEVRSMSCADDRLFRDMLNNIGGVRFADEVFYPDAPVREIIKIENIEECTTAGSGAEKWTISHGDQGTASYVVTYSPDGFGGTFFSVQKQKK